MSCYCDDGVLPDFYHKECRKARKAHRCYECGCKIERGEVYEYVRGKWDDDPISMHTCPDCVRLRDAFCEMECFCWLHGSLLDDVETQFQDADFSPGLRYAYLRIVAAHRWRKRKKFRVTC